MGNGADVVVVGAGFVGSTTALELARGGARVTIVDAHHPGWGASGRNIGYVWLHTRSAGVQMELAAAGRRMYDELVEDLEDFEFRPCGGMTYFFEEQADYFPAFVQERREAGLPMELLDGAAARKACPLLPDRVAGATWNPLDAHVHPARLATALARAAETAGATILLETPIQALEVEGGRCLGVRTAAGTMHADRVVVAAGAWSTQLLEPLGLPLPIVPMRLQVAETEPCPVRFDPILYGPTAIKQYAFVKELPGFREEPFVHPLEASVPGVEFLELAAQRRDGRVLLGCPMDFPGYDDRPTVEGLGLTFAVLGDHLPALRGLAVEETWAGLLPQSPDALPVLGPVAAVEGLVLATGHVFGVTAGPLSGRLVAQQIAGGEPSFDLGPFRYERESIAAAVEEHRRW
jgi:glycine/D-amino acid oxidase-like deaminating enzyme